MDPQEGYYTYWGLAKPPFDNVPDSEMYFDLHRSVENAVSETIFAIEVWCKRYQGRRRL
jgi:hypothetical protein